MPLAAATATAIASVASAGAAQQTPEGGGTSPQGDDAGPSQEQAARTTDGKQSQQAEEQAPRARMSLTKATPRRKYVDSGRKVKFKFELDGERKRDLVVKAIRLADGEVKRRWVKEDVKPGETKRVSWNGKLRGGGGFTRQGKHAFRVFVRGKRKTDMSEAEGRKRFRIYRHRFPIRARHSYGDGYGAGRGHQGVDVFAKCGKRLRAVRGGKVVHRGYHGAAGRYIVIDGHATGRDYVYMHMQRRQRPKLGERVRTGERIGYVGRTGNASGCHLHFEVWTRPGWYDGGRPVRRVKRMLRRWDEWS